MMKLVKPEKAPGEAIGDEKLGAGARQSGPKWRWCRDVRGRGVFEGSEKQFIIGHQIDDSFETSVPIFIDFLTALASLVEAHWQANFI